jgi:adenine-specific DNA-methyltransferase
MPGKKTKNSSPPAASLPNVSDYRHPEATRKNNPPAKIAAEGHVPLLPKAEYSYSPRRPPELRFDSTGSADELPELLASATGRKLTGAEAWALAEALRAHEPWLEWAGKREAKSFAVDPVALHIHERVSAQAILRVAAREDVNRSLFADPEQEYNEAVQFYQHDVGWSNRLILGDSLQVMSSLARREDLAGKVQMIYIDPPYGIKFKSNFQPTVGSTEVKDKESDLTREPEMIKAYRDTWVLGVHSYLSYLRDRLTAVKELLADTGSVFVQIGDENLHSVRSVMDEVFGTKNSIVMLVVKKKSQAPITESINDYLLWYAKDKSQVRFRPLTEAKLPTDQDSRFKKVELHSGERRPVKLFPSGAIPAGARFVNDDYPVVSQDPSATRSGSFLLHGNPVVPGPNRHWTYDPETDLKRLEKCDRLRAAENTARGVIYWDDYDRSPVSNIWDFHGEPDPVYVVQTNRGIVERCLLMTTDPGDLVLDPTCGSGTTAFVAEQWGRRWITVDTSRVAIAITRQRLLTAKYDYYKLHDEAKGVVGGFRCRTVPKVTLKSIAQNTNLDPIFAQHEPILEKTLASASRALAAVPHKVRQDLLTKLLLKQKREGKKAITDADRRRWELPAKGKGWQHWDVPFDTDPDYPTSLKQAVEAYRAAWRAKMDEVNACIAANADQEELVDQPEKDSKITRVSGPFTVEAVQPPEMSLGDAILIEPDQFAGEPDDLETTFVVREVRVGESAQNLEAYLSKMVDLLRMDGVRFPDNKQRKFTRLDPIYSSGSSSGIHAEGRWVNQGEADPDPDGAATVGVVFGPQYGPITAKMVEEVIRPAARRYDDLVFAGFSFDGPAQAAIEEGHPRLRIHIAHIRPDVNPGMNGLLKEQPGSQLFTVFGRPRTNLEGPDAEGMCRVEMQGVDIYDPVTNNIVDTGAAKVAAWFLDSDYDGRTFCITQAFFPDRTAWEKLSKALDGVVDPERFEAFSGTVSLLFPVGAYKCVAVKVIDPRGNEVMRVHSLGGGDVR